MDRLVQAHDKKAQGSATGQRSSAPAIAAEHPLQTNLLQLQRKIGNQATNGLVAQQLQRKADSVATTTQPVQRKGKMPDEVQVKMESAFNTDFSNVNIHEGSQASSVGAVAYAQGNDIHFAQGQYNPHSQNGQELLGHELAHIVQQRKGRVKPTTTANGLPVNDDPSLEKEADDQGRKAAQTKMKTDEGM